MPIIKNRVIFIYTRLEYQILLNHLRDKIQFLTLWFLSLHSEQHHIPGGCPSKQRWHRSLLSSPIAESSGLLCGSCYSKWVPGENCGSLGAGADPKGRVLADFTEIIFQFLHHYRHCLIYFVRISIMLTYHCIYERLKELASFMSITISLFTQLKLSLHIFSANMVPSS